MKQPVDQLCFLHIPKAAGTTLFTILRKQYPPGAVVTVGPGFTSLTALQQLPQTERARIRVLRGHLPFGMHEYLGAGQTTPYITMLRDPVERVASHYYYILREPDNEHHARLTREAIDLATFVSSGMSFETDNLQTRLLAGGEYFDAPFGTLDETALQTAQRHLEVHFVVAGLSERFDESLLLLRRALGWSLPLYFNRNVTRNRPRQTAIPAATRQIIHQHNQFDLRLYEYAAARLAADIKAAGPSFQRELQWFQRLNGVYSLLGPAIYRTRRGLARLFSRHRP